MIYKLCYIFILAVKWKDDPAIIGRTNQ